MIFFDLREPVLTKMIARTGNYSLTVMKVLSKQPGVSRIRMCEACAIGSQVEQGVWVCNWA
jgi:hypothetical protein